ncbi:pentatricopeptide repeat-containing protein At2g36980, mitochondrial-like [Wolffia australiana]
MDPIPSTRLLLSLARSGAISAARRLFDEMPIRDTIAWNAMLASYAQSPFPHLALRLFPALLASSAAADAFSLSAALSAASSAAAPCAGAALHAVAVSLGLVPASRPVVAAARKLFDEMPVRSPVAWNTLLKGYADWGESELAVSLFVEMAGDGFVGDGHTFSVLGSVASETGDRRLGLSVHGKVIKLGWAAAVEVGNSLISVYAKLGLPGDAQKVFDHLPERTQISWNAVMDAHSRSGHVGAAMRLFVAAPERNAVSFTTVIAAMARQGQPGQALELFSAMISAGIAPDELAFAPALSACSALALLNPGTAAHAVILRRGFDTDLLLSNGIIYMYAKCGDLRASMMAFRGAQFRDLVSWNSLILGMAVHGKAGEAMAVLAGMEKTARQTDGFTVCGVLVGCSHGGMVEQGMSLFAELVDGDGDEVVSCAVDVLSRAGMLREAAELGVICGDSDEDEEAVAAGMVALSNERCMEGNWGGAEDVRRAMAARGTRKEVGGSWVEMGGVVEVFGSGVFGGLLEGEVEMVREVVGCLHLEMRQLG